MDTKCDIATKRFTEGFHCSQSVLEAFAADYGSIRFWPENSQSACWRFRTGRECGAVTGALMVLGLHYGMAEPDDSEAFQDTFEKVGRFVEEFKARHGTA
ncbi:MAG: C-GCAxxG-C-C family protein [Desulfobacterales bacterium]|nr:C-GCAxxG-C-C family protein [Desulfobacterales bacterium]